MEPAMKLDADRLLSIMQETICASVRADGPDLSARQLAILLVIGLDRNLHTVRGLSARLCISKPAISRSLDRLCTLGLAARAEDVRDRRSVLVIPTDAGMDHVADLGAFLNEAAHSRRRTPAMRETRIAPPCMAAE
jgi:DNA-binding MarR family transcriptional regulator